ncbi:MAG TPA: hypothetical protein VMB19_15325 [Silvibacterium sp.]|nr:hypothetical protein [Silvibacterium sp.]
MVPSGETNPTPERDEDVHHASTDVFNRYYRYPYHDEETFDFGPNPTHKLMLAFGIFNQKDGKVTYESLPVPAPPPPITPRNYLPVTISFDTYTITATTVVLDRKTRELRADGTVWIADGSSSPPRLVSCAVVRLDDAEPQVHECETGPSEHGASK